MRGADAGLVKYCHSFGFGGHERDRSEGVLRLEIDELNLVRIIFPPIDASHTNIGAQIVNSGSALTTTDYFLVTDENGKAPHKWTWEIRRRSQPMGVRLTGEGYQSRSAAEFAGQRALTEFLDLLAKEERRR